MPDHGLVGTDQQIAGVRPERKLSRQSLRDITLGRGRAVGIEIANLVRIEAGVVQGIIHTARSTLTPW